MYYLMLSLAALSAACSGSVAPREISPRAADESQEVVQIKFDPSPDERETLMQAVRLIRQRNNLSHIAASVERFGSEPARYFVFVIPPPDSNDGNVHFGVVEARTDTIKVSTLYDTGVPFSPSAISIDRIEDADQDGLLDVLYCIWPSDSAKPGIVRIVGYVSDKWYTVDRRSNERRCVRAGES